jgi:hypothetical protein
VTQSFAVLLVSAPVSEELSMDFCEWLHRVCENHAFWLGQWGKHGVLKLFEWVLGGCNFVFGFSVVAALWVRY